MVVLLLLGILIGGVVFLYNSAMFEREAPQITLETNGYWNLKKPLRLHLQDASGIKSYSVSIQNANGNHEVVSGAFVAPRKDLVVDVTAPRGVHVREKTLRVVVTAQDASRWNFFNGNTVTKTFTLKIDRRRPLVTVLANSYKIAKGGSALVVFKAKDENLKSVKIETNFGKVFYATPFYKEGYYIALVAWPVQERSFRANVVVDDLAGNVVKAHIPLYLKERHYKISRITISDRFLHGKIADLASQFDETAGVDDPLEQFKIINEEVRAKNEALIHQITSKVPTEMIDDFSIHKMYPLKNAAVVASFADHRYYYYKGKLVSQAYHMGLDLASKAMASIKPQNGGEVVFADFNGLYGNMPIIHHGLGLYTLYGHCSELFVNKGDRVNPKDTIARTGKSGYAMGDHLHFGVLVQGIEVRPQEWMDKRWIKLNVTDVIKLAKKMIDKE